jgi:hypothetical protein
MFICQLYRMYLIAYKHSNQLPKYLKNLVWKIFTDYVGFNVLTTVSI